MQPQPVVRSFAVGFSPISVFFPVQRTGPANTIRQIVISSAAQHMDFCDDASGNGRARALPNKSSVGLCAKCSKLATLTEGSAEYDQWKVSR